LIANYLNVSNLKLNICAYNSNVSIAILNVLNQLNFKLTA
jgi:hypothetical protein